MKKNRRIIPTRFLPHSATRITNNEGQRVWLIHGKQYVSKRDYFLFLDKEKARKEKEALEAIETERIRSGIAQQEQAVS